MIRQGIRAAVKKTCRGECLNISRSHDCCPKFTMRLIPRLAVVSWMLRRGNDCRASFAEVDIDLSGGAVREPQFALGALRVSGDIQDADASAAGALAGGRTSGPGLSLLRGKALFWTASLAGGPENDTARMKSCCGRSGT